MTPITLPWQRDDPAHGETAGRVAGARLPAYAPACTPSRLLRHLRPDCPLCAQIKVRDLSHTSVSIAPADYSTWHDVRSELMAEAKTGFKARVEAELAAAQGESLDELKAVFQQEERAIEHTIDHEVHTFSASVDVSYNFLSH